MFFYPVLDALSDGRVIRRVVQGILRVSAWIMALLGLLFAVQVLKAGLQARDALPTVGAVLFAIVSLGAVACAFQIYYYRARSIDELGPSEYTVIPVVSILCRLTGEVLATLFAAAAVGLCLASWLGGSMGSPFASEFGPGPMLMSENNFVMGLVFFGWFLFAAFGAILFFYFLAESVVVLADIARHTRRLAVGAPPEPLRPAAAPRPASPAHARPHQPAPAPAPRPHAPAPAAAPAPGPTMHEPPRPPVVQPHPAPPAPAHGTAPLCRSCGARNELGSAFCSDCGAAL
jgi:hypothetical protein